jgi:hypothetical protein
MTAHKTPNDLVVRISFQASMGESRGAVFETYLPQDAAITEYHAVMDKLRKVAERQEAIKMVKDIAIRLEADKANLAALVADMKRVETDQINRWDAGGRKGPFKLSESENTHRKNLEGSIINRQKAIELLEIDLVRYTAIVEGTV